MWKCGSLWKNKLSMFDELVIKDIFKDSMHNQS